ncbi:hypothetical protein [Pseudarthrobacter sp. N5]
MFLSPRARDFFLDWDRAASDLVANLRILPGVDTSPVDILRMSRAPSTA